MKTDFENSITRIVSSRAGFAYSRYWLHKYQAVMQFGRVQSALNERSLSGEWLKEPDIEQTDAVRLWRHFGSTINKKVMSEIHLFFIAVDNVKDMMNVIVSEEGLTHLKKKVGSIIHAFDHYTHGRNTFEHFDDRIPGGKKHGKVGETKSSFDAGSRRILGGLRGDVYTFGDKEWSLSSQEFHNTTDGMAMYEAVLHEYLNDFSGES